MAKISKRTVDALQPDAARDTFLWDDGLPGFGARCRPSGQKTYLLKYRAAGNQRWLTLGKHGELTPDQARARALRHKVDVSDGADPSAAKQARRQEGTVSDVIDRYLAEHVALHNNPSTAAEVRKIVERRIKPGLGTIKITALKRSDVARWHQGMSGTPYEANRALAYLSKALSLASTVWELRDGNPCKGIRRFPERVRERFLDDAEMARLGAALTAAEQDQLERPEAIRLIRLLAVTGMRLGEVCGLAWDDIDLQQRTIRLRDAKAGARTVHLSGAAVAILAAAPDKAGYLASSALDPDRPITRGALEHVWSRLRARARLDGVRLHDLSHSVGTLAAIGGANVFAIRDLLGHKTLQMTNRYVGRATELVQATADAVGTRIAAAMAAADNGGEVVKLHTRRRRSTSNSIADA
jgi:integrase